MTNKLLSTALTKVEKLQKKGTVFQGKDFSIEDRRVLKHTGFIKPILKGWYYISKPNEKDNDTTSWHISYIEFIEKYLKSRFKKGYCLNPEDSLLFHTGIVSIPKQIIVLVKNPINEVINLPHGTSMVIYTVGAKFPKKDQMAEKYGINIYSLERAICHTKPIFFKNDSENVQIALNILQDISPVLSILLDEKMKSSAGRIVGALEFIGRDIDANRIKNTWKSAFLETLSIANPFEKSTPVLSYSRNKNPHALRIKAKWEKWREIVMNVSHVEAISLRSINLEVLEKEIEEKYTEDAYHSLSIEGYTITRELIEKVSQGTWDSDNDDEDKGTKNALAAKGYHNAFKAVVKDTIKTIDEQNDVAGMIKIEHHEWYNQLFSASVLAGIITERQLAGYRRSPIYLRNSIHVPLPADALVDAMEAYFEKMNEESDPFVRAVLGHRMFGYIHPYFDGNGRMARFIMNSILVTSGYKWLIIKVDNRKEYLETLERASGETDDIEPFAKFIAKNLEKL